MNEGKLLFRGEAAVVGILDWGLVRERWRRQGGQN